MIKRINDFLLIVAVSITFILTVKIYDAVTDKIKPMPFDSRLCINTGKIHRYIVIGEKGAVIERYEPILDCTNLDKYNGV